MIEDDRDEGEHDHGRGGDHHAGARSHAGNVTEIHRNSVRGGCPNGTRWNAFPDVSRRWRRPYLGKGRPVVGDILHEINRITANHNEIVVVDETDQADE